MCDVEVPAVLTRTRKADWPSLAGLHASPASSPHPQGPHRCDVIHAGRPVGPDLIRVHALNSAAVTGREPGGSAARELARGLEI
jgi:hypothetical protein